MKKIFTTFAMVAIAMSSFAQSYQNYYRVEFTVPVSLEGKTYSGSNNSVSATMKDNYTYCNPEHEYLDFQATDNPMKLDNSTHSYSATSSYYLTFNRMLQSGLSENEVTRFSCDKISKITSYSNEVQTITVDSVKTHRLSKTDNPLIFPGDYPTTPGHEYYDVSEFTFNRLPLNVAELKTLMENSDGSRKECCNNPLFIAAVGCLIWPRLLDCSQDAHDMWDYLYGKQYAALNTTGIANQTFQNACISQYVGKDDSGHYKHYNAFQFFGGATPGNQYKPNGKSYAAGDGPFKVRVGWDVNDPVEYDGTRQCNVASILLFPNPDATSKDDISFEYPVGHVVKIRSTNKNGWFLSDGEKTYYAIGKAQYDTDF